ncbi:MAG: phospholipase D-like domain-containing protein [Candidatus Paceibacterota bacterium]
MTLHKKRLVGALFLLLAAGTGGYSIGTTRSAAPVSIPVANVAAPAPGSVRVLYSLDQKQNDQELIALIEGAKTHIYFAVYTFTLTNVAEALVAAKARGVDVRGITDSGQSAEKFSQPVMDILRKGGVPIVVEKHPTGNGIMHLKMLVTDSAYAHGSYNWTKSANTLNDEILEIGTDETLRKTYENILLKLLEAYKGNTAAGAAVSIGTIDYTEAPEHIGKQASVQGTLLRAYTSAGGTTFLDFCKNYKTCPFTAVIFSDDLKAFGDLSHYEGSVVTLTGKIVSYQGKAEIILDNPSQISK